MEQLFKVPASSVPVNGEPDSQKKEPGQIKKQKLVLFHTAGVQVCLLYTSTSVGNNPDSQADAADSQNQTDSAYHADGQNQANTVITDSINRTEDVYKRQIIWRDWR